MNGMKKVRVGVIGLGVGERHVEAYNSLPDVEVKAICDIDPQRLKDVGDRHGVSLRYEDHRSITESDDIDAVSICTYDDVHAEQTISALRNGKHVMVEKPAVLKREEAEWLLTAHQESGRILTSNLILRTSPRFRELKQMVDQGRLGEIFYMEGDYIHQILWKIVEGWRGQMDFYCVLYGGGIHLIDLMRWIIGEEIVEVCGMSNKILTKGTSYAYDDTTVNLLRFEGGALAKTTTTFGPQRSKFHPLLIYGTKGTFVNDKPNAKLFFGEKAADEEVVTTPYPGIQKGDLIPDFIGAIRAGTEPMVRAVDVFRVMDVCFAAMRSMIEGKTLRVDYLI
jgi:UDP-N-acetyl-2-amino-2-deoxyglucuronate dehydrogenase